MGNNLSNTQKKENESFQYSSNVIQNFFGPLERRNVLFYKTQINNVDKILSSKILIPNEIDSQFGHVISLSQKIKYSNDKDKDKDKDKDNKFVYLVVQVVSPKTYLFNSEGFQNNKIDFNYLKQEGFSAIMNHSSNYNYHSHKMYVIDQKIIKNINFAYGMRPHTYVHLNEQLPRNNDNDSDNDRMILFYGTSFDESKDIIEKKQMKEEEGPFGSSYYMFETINDALIFKPGSQVFIMNEIKNQNIYKLRNQKNINSKEIPSKFQLLIGNNGLMKYYIIKDLTIIERIQICST